MPQTWPVTCGHESGTPLQKLDDWERGSYLDQMDKCGSDGEVGVRLYVSNMLVGRPTTMHDWKYGWSMPVGLFVISSVGRSVEPSDWLAISYHPPTIHLSDRWPTIQNQFFYKRSVLEISVSVVPLIPVSVRPFGCGGAAWPMPVSRWSSVGSVSSLGYTPPRLDEHSLDKSGNTL